MRGERTSVVQGDQEENVNDSRLRVINAERLILSRSSHQLVGQFCAVIASVPVERRREPEQQFPSTVAGAVGPPLKSKTSQ
jgi:hypothetical protein